MEEAPLGAVAVPETSSATASILDFVSPSTAICGPVDDHTPGWMTQADFSLLMRSAVAIHGTKNVVWQRSHRTQ
jgi:hypothetical protein